MSTVTSIGGLQYSAASPVIGAIASIVTSISKVPSALSLYPVSAAFAVGVRFTPTQPDALRIEELMLLEYQCLNIQSPALQPDLQELRAQIIAEAKQEAADLLRSITPDPTEGRRR